VNPTVWRHSVAYHLALLGWSIDEAADYLGHSDTKMIREVYNQVVPSDRSPKRLDWTNANMASIRDGITSRAVVFDFQKARPGTPPHPARRLQSLKSTAAGEE
jgi:integrase